MSDRPSLPPGDDSLRLMTEHYKQVNDRHEAAIAAVVTVTDEQRIAMARELWALHVLRGYVHMDQTLTVFEQEAKARVAASAKPKVGP